MIDRLKKHLSDSGLRYEIIDLSELMENSMEIEDGYRKYVERIKKLLDKSQREDETTNHMFNESESLRIYDDFLKGCSDLENGCTKSVKPIRDNNRPKSIIDDVEEHNKKIADISKLLSTTKEECIEHCIENIIKDFNIFIDASTFKEFTRNSFVNALHDLITKSNTGKLVFISDETIKIEIVGLKSLFIIPFMRNKNMFNELETVTATTEQLNDYKKDIQIRLLKKLTYMALIEINTIIKKINKQAVNPTIELSCYSIKTENEKVYVDITKNLLNTNSR